MRIHVLGDIAADTFGFVDHNDVSLKCRLNPIDCEIAFKYGHKIPLPELYHCSGGNAGNVAVALSRLGFETNLYSNVGTDTAGVELLNSLKKEGVNINGVKVNKNKVSNQSFIIVYRGERTIFSHHEDCSTGVPTKVKEDAVYLTSSAADWREQYEKVLQSKILIYQPGTLQIRAKIDESKKILASCDILILNQQEAQQFLSSKELDEIWLLNKLLETGVKEVVMTLGKEGSVAANEFGKVKVGVNHSLVKKEPTGSGDAYAAAYVAGRLKGLSMTESMLLGTTNAGQVMQFVGAQSGLLNWKDITSKSKQAKIKVKEL